jgi:hypothetical protein
VRSGLDAYREATEQQDEQRDPDHECAQRMVESALVLTMAHAFTLAERPLRDHPSLTCANYTVVVANLSGLTALACVPGLARLFSRSPAWV